MVARVGRLRGEPVSTTIQEHAEYAAERAAYLKNVATVYPDATLERLWDDGPLVPVLFTENALKIATGVQIVTSKGLAGDRPIEMLLPYFLVGKGKARGRVYVFPSQFKNYYAQQVIDALPTSSLLAAMEANS
jgi:hypothetical protein